MESLNFEFLRKARPELADLGAFAELYAHNDVPSALVKLRTFAESMLSAIYAANRIPKTHGSSFYDLLADVQFTDTTPQVVVNKLDLLRKKGNKGAHGDAKYVKTYDVLNYIKDAYSLGQWFAIRFDNQDANVIPEFRAEALSTPKSVKDKKETNRVLEKLAVQEEAMANLLEELEAARQKIKEQENLTPDQKEAITEKGQKIASILNFSEAETRKQLIDEMIIEAGWDINNADEVTLEEPVKHQPTKTGIGYADYVLWGDDGKPLAVIEAKSVKHDVRKGKPQAIIYADGLEKEYEQRPIIFYTNGYDIRLLDDAKGEPERQVFGYYSKESLVYTLQQSSNREKLTDLNPKEEIADRLYQIEAVKRVMERFENQKRRQALIIQATGTGKTRVAISISELMFRAKWAKRILFLCDRKELRKQANNAYKEFMPDAPRLIVSRKTSGDKTARIYLSTYPGMMKCFNKFDIGFFDLIIADESHRSIYNRYSDIFSYFDAYQIGLTATPVKFVHRNTYQLFGCEDLDPTVYYGYEEAISHNPPHLCHFKVTKHTTKFLRDGIKYNQMTREQQFQLENQVEDAESIDYTKENVNKIVFNKATDAAILDNLMNNGIRNADGSSIGKTIIFARNHNHAVVLSELFKERYPQYGATYCQVIDNYCDRSDQLIDDFKDEDSKRDLTIAISVDMLDTGIDVPSIVNLVFAKPVKSYSKFWQMIGRGTRLCPDLFGPGKHKQHFQIFDHWGNFEYFDELTEEVEPAHSKSLMEQLFSQRITLAEVALKKQEVTAFKTSIELISGDISALPEKTISVRQYWRDVQQLQNIDTLNLFDATTKHKLQNNIAPLMLWRNLNKEEAAYRFDLICSKAQAAAINQTSDIFDFAAKIKDQVSRLPSNLKQVEEKIEIIKLVQGEAFWAKDNISFDAIETVRLALRSIMKYIPPLAGPGTSYITLDISDGEEMVAEHKIEFKGLDLVEYRLRVQSLFSDLLDESPALQKIKAGEKVTVDELNKFISRVKYASPDFSLDDFLNNFAGTENRLEMAIRQIVGMHHEKVDQHFKQFVQNHPDMSSYQIKFLDMLTKHISQHGSLEVKKLWEAPFNTMHADGIDGIFPQDAYVDEIIDIVTNINELVTV